MVWLLKQETADALDAAARAGLQPTIEQREKFANHRETIVTAFHDTEAAGSEAVIPIKGVLTPKPDLFAALFGGGNTSYESINLQLQMAAADPRVKQIALDIDSPGGDVDGLFNTVEMVKSAKAAKPMRVIAANANSAAYAIATAAGDITATNRGATFGSIGVATTRVVSDSLVTLTSSDAPEKMPDPTTDKGKAAIVKHLDAVNALFVETVSQGRNVSESTVRSEFGQGAVILAGDAEKRGMIDGIQAPRLVAVKDTKTATANIGGRVKGSGMTLEELKAQFPAVYKAALDEGIALGQASERDRVIGHLTMGEASGDLQTAFAAIREGELMTQTLQSKYMAAGLSRSDVNARQTESDETASAVDEADGAKETASQGSLVADALEALRGVSHG